jgi:2,3-dihydro-2,3-dihydroxybenzoate dehydrogenase
MNQQKDKKIAWVTGVNQGIGAAIFRHLQQDGIEVIGFDKSKSSVPEHLQDCVYECDVRDPLRVESLCQQLLKTHPPDFFISVAGILQFNEFHHSTADEWQNTFAVNLFGPMYFMQHLTPLFQSRRGGNVVFVASNAAHVPRKGMAAYGASKAALLHLSKTLALELAPHGVRVNSVSPGSTLTAMQTDMWRNEAGEQQTIIGDLANYKLGIPLQKLATVDDIANAVIFLISEQARHITMHDLVVDGGATLGA